MAPPNLRDSAASFELNGGSGPILYMVGLDNFLEAYKSDTTFCIKTPEIVDPSNTNPNAPWVITRIAGVGASSFAIARAFLQGHEMLNQGLFVQGFNKDLVLNRLHACKEQLVICEQTANRVARRIVEVIQRIEAEGINRDNNGHALNPFPQVQDLVSDTTLFLVHAKRAITELTTVISAALNLEVQGANFQQLGERLSASVGAGAPLTKYVQDQEPTVKYLIDLRNLQEHPGEIRTIITDFCVLPTGQIASPKIHLSHQDPQALHEYIHAAARYLVKLTEAAFIHSIMLRLSGNIPFYIEEIESTAIKAECPIKYKLSIGLSVLPHMQEGG